MTMRIGIFGGTFDPVHFGHLILAEQCREQFRLDEVRFIPAGVPPHKQQSPILEGAHRVEMLKFATAGHDAFTIDERELRREGASYTVDTLTELTAELPEDEFCFLIGGDSLHDLPTWREPERISELATIVAVNRGDEPLPADDELESQLGSTIAKRLQLVTMPAIELSSTDLRHRVRAGKSIRYMTPRSVEVYIRQQGLYAK